MIANLQFSAETEFAKEGKQLLHARLTVKQPLFAEMENARELKRIPHVLQTANLRLFAEMENAMELKQLQHARLIALLQSRNRNAITMPTAAIGRFAGATNALMWNAQMMPSAAAARDAHPTHATPAAMGLMDATANGN
ncbi:MAG: hypothetical protein NUV67_01550 [archaeon]|nr:hypothetical protein [archaeon]